MWITCKCGHTDEFDNFCKTAFSGELPRGQYQCPCCSYAWKRVESDFKVLTAGSESMLIPTKLEIVPIESFL